MFLFQTTDYSFDLILGPMTFHLLNFLPFTLTLPLQSVCSAVFSLLFRWALTGNIQCLTDLLTNLLDYLS